MTITTLKLKGMSCAACANSVEKAIRQVPGVRAVQVNFAAEQAQVDYGHRSNLTAIQAAVSDAGYEAFASDLSVNEDKENREKAQAQRSLLIKTAISGAVGVALMWALCP
jgi:P-type Cu+ transporter